MDQKVQRKFSVFSSDVFRRIQLGHIFYNPNHGQAPIETCVYKDLRQLAADGTALGWKRIIVKPVCVLGLHVERGRLAVGGGVGKLTHNNYKSAQIFI